MYTYDTEWNNALNPATGGLPSWVSVTSFNEWHEGSTIEPARSSPPASFGYETYNGAYGRTGTSAETAYLDRTAFSANEFENRRNPNPNLALNRPATADSQCAPAEGPAKAVNGTVTGGNNDKWCSLGTTRFLRIDLGVSTPVSRVVIRHSGAGGEPVRWNTPRLRPPDQPRRHHLDHRRHPSAATPRTSPPTPSPTSAAGCRVLANNSSDIAQQCRESYRRGSTCPAIDLATSHRLAAARACGAVPVG
jgi:hypothetical protein